MSESQARKLSLTAVLIAVNVLVFIRGSIVAGTLWPTKVTQFDIDYGEIGIAIALDNEWWRLFTGGFLHRGLAHVFFNMLLLWFLGRSLESLIGVVRFFFLYFGALLAGAFGALLLEDAFTVTVGASGAVFGLMGSVLVLRLAKFRRREIVWSSAVAAVLGALFFVGGLWAAELSLPDGPFFYNGNFYIR